jgi:hypothetical protein
LQMRRNTRLPLLPSLRLAWGSLEIRVCGTAFRGKTKLEVSHVDGIDMLAGAPNSFYGVTLVCDEVSTEIPLLYLRVLRR